MVSAPACVDTRSELCSRLALARARTDELFAIVKPEALYDRPIPERHRIVFYVGHLEAFDWNLLRDRLFALNAFHADFDQLFAFGIDPVGGGLPTDQPGDWPALQQVRDYVRRSRETLDAAIEGFLDFAASTTQHGSAQNAFFPDLLLNVAIEHRLMHAETLAYMLHQLPLYRKFRQPGRMDIPVRFADSQMVEIPAGSATLGLARNANAFGWDNEFDEHIVAVPAFSIDRHPVTNRQFLEFLNAGGYDDRNLWSNADWAWKTEQKISHPAFWDKREDAWYQRTMFDERPLAPEWPVYVSHAEASAYARRQGKSLPTEAQWHRAAYGTPDGSERAFPWGNEIPRRSYGNFDFQSWDPSAVGNFPAGRSAFGVGDLVGNGWEWTSSRFEPFAGFEPFPFYPGYSANFFDGQHYVLKGGSPRTAACMLRRSFRNWFQPHYQYVYAGFRCVHN